MDFGELLDEAKSAIDKFDKVDASMEEYVNALEDALVELREHIELKIDAAGI